MALNLRFSVGERLLDDQGRLTVEAAARLNAIGDLAQAAVAQDTGTANWAAATGTATRTTFDTSTVTTSQLAERFKAALDDFLASGALK